MTSVVVDVRSGVGTRGQVVSVRLNEDPTAEVAVPGPGRCGAMAIQRSSVVTERPP
ncbi:hypothetical protein [Arthrobacter sp. A5]|uniref:hypothetical protein n=1 Tax=Arthrobacter sp. A5 TaxID=576926 RepID=UPI003DA9109E